MRKAIMRTLLICIMSILSIFVPYLPGNYDNNAVMVSAILQIAAFASLLFIPLGIIWAAFEICSKRNIPEKRMVLMSVFTVVYMMFFLASLLSALGGIGPFRGSTTVAVSLALLCAYLFISKLLPFFRKLKHLPDNNVCYFFIYLLIIPTIIVGIRMAFIENAANFSRNIAIANSKTIIESLEKYKEQYGFYPDTLQGAWKDYSSGVIGVEKYHYKTNGDVYDLYFEHFNPDLTTIEIVMYNKSDNHVIRSHPSFVFSLPPDQFEIYRGYFKEDNLQQTNWKSFLFD